MVINSAFEPDGQLVYLLNAGVVDYLICDDSDLMSLGALAVQRLHELEQADSASAQLFSARAGAGPPVLQVRVVVGLVILLVEFFRAAFVVAALQRGATVARPRHSVGQRQFSMVLGTLYVVMLCCNRLVHMQAKILVLVLVRCAGTAGVSPAPSVSSTLPPSPPSTC